MSSPAAAAISAMITSQVYPQMRLPPPTRTVARHRTEEMEPESVGIFAKGTIQAIGSFQILLGMGILAALCFSVLTIALSLPSIVMSLTASIVHMINGAVSCSRWRCMARVKRRLMVIRVTITTNVLGAVTAIVSVVVYSLSFTLWHQDIHGYVGSPVLALAILVLLSVLELGFAVLTALYSWKDLDHIELDSDPVAYSREGEREAAMGSGDGKPQRLASSISL